MALCNLWMKIFFAVTDRGGQIADFLRKKTESVTVKVTNFVSSQKWGSFEIPGFKSGRTQSFLTGSTFRGEALKERSEGSWRSGRRRSEGCMRREHRQPLRLILVAPGTISRSGVSVVAPA